MTNIEEKNCRILIVDDQSSITNMLREILDTKYTCVTANSGEEALTLLQTQEFNLVLSDIEMGEISGIDIIPHILASSPDTVVVMISGNQDIESAIAAMRVGAFDYIKKPFNLDHVEIAVERALYQHFLLVDKRENENQLEELVKERTAELNYLSYHDILTELPNRNLFEDRLSQALSLVNYNRQNLAVLLLSISCLKNIYDVLGQNQGNRLLREVSERLKSHILEGVTISKFEGDEFAIMLTQINNTEDVIEFTNNLKESLQFPFLIDGEEFHITFSIGISLSPTDGQDGHTLLKNAGVALSRSKELGRINYQFYTTDMNTFALMRLGMENDLRRALEREEFEVYYQPKLCVKMREIVGMEALVRWHHPRLGFVSPTDFIPMAEETGLILPLGEWVLRTACTQIKAWQNEGLPLLQISVNLSAHQLQQDDLFDVITGIIRDTKIDPAFLELELTESAIMKNAGVAIRILRKIKEIGIRISIDDFGTGYSSLGYLKKLPVDILKIDKSFIQDMTTSPDDASLVMTIITLAHNLGLKVIAEGVETEEQLRFLHLLRCNEWQGYLFSKPVSANAFKDLLVKTSKSKEPEFRNNLFNLENDVELPRFSNQLGEGMMAN